MPKTISLPVIKSKKGIIHKISSDEGPLNSATNNTNVFTTIHTITLTGITAPAFTVFGHVLCVLSNDTINGGSAVKITLNDDSEIDASCVTAIANERRTLTIPIRYGPMLYSELVTPGEFSITINIRSITAGTTTFHGESTDLYTNINLLYVIANDIGDV